MADEPTQSEVAAEFGYSLAFFKTNSELYALLKKATAEGYSPSRFVAALQNTKWFRTTSESARKYAVLKATDPAGFNQQLNQTIEHIKSLGGRYGAPLRYTDLRSVALKAMQMGWNDEQITRLLSTRLVRKKDGTYTGQAGETQRLVRRLAQDYGVSVGDKWIANVVRDSITGARTSETIAADFQRMAASKYVALKDRIMAGETVRDIADPYIQSYGKLLELNSENIDLDDPLIQRALQARDAKGQPTTQTLYDFEQVLRNDKRWAKTMNAQNQMSAVVSDVLKTFGLFGG